MPPKVSPLAGTRREEARRRNARYRANGQRVRCYVTPSGVLRCDRLTSDATARAVDWLTDELADRAWDAPDRT